MSRQRTQGTLHAAAKRCGSRSTGLVERRPGNPADSLFPSVRGGPLSRDGAERLLAKHVANAGRQCPTLAKKHISMHVLRHSAAMDLLQQGVDRSVIALWLGHESIETTEMYLHASMAMKEKALAKATPSKTRNGRYRPTIACSLF